MPRVPADDAIRRLRQLRPYSTDPFLGTPENPGQPMFDSQGYILWVKLRFVKDPEMYRLIRVPANTTFHRLHKILGIAFGWDHSNDHLYAFDLYSRHEEDEQPRAIMMEEHTMMNDDVPIERAIFGSSITRKLSVILNYKHQDWRRVEGPIRIVYKYDMGDGWEHDIIPVGVDNQDDGNGIGLSGQQQEVYVFGGLGCPCEENSGGPAGWSVERDRLVAEGTIPWAAAWDMDAVNEQLRRYRTMTNRGKRWMKQHESTLMDRSAFA